MECIFCKIINGEIPSEKLYEDEQCLVIRDIRPQAPVHVLVIPKRHISSTDAINAENAGEVAHLFTVIPKAAVSLGVSGAYRLISNCGEAAGQTVKHLHFHLLGGADMGDRII